MYQSRMKSIIVLAICLVASSVVAEGQIFDKILNTNNNRNTNDVEVISNGANRELPGERQQQQQPVVSRMRDMFKDMMTVNVPVFYDMIRNGSSLGINVLSGMVKVERGEEAERSGLVSNGVRRPLSVRVFGVPVYERGTRIRPLESGSAAGGPDATDRPSSRPDEEELPL